jgi:hypothetical protein
MCEAAFVHICTKDLRAHHRRQRQRNDAGDGDRSGQREGKLRKQCTGQTALEADWHVRRDEDDGHRDDRPAKLACRLYRCRKRSHALFQMAVDVLDHDDGVVHHQTDCEHQGQQGQ